jgi:hypothetical protein
VSYEEDIADKTVPVDGTHEDDIAPYEVVAGEIETEYYARAKHNRGPHCEIEGVNPQVVMPYT